MCMNMISIVLEEFLISCNCGGGALQFSVALLILEDSAWEDLSARKLETAMT